MKRSIRCFVLVALASQLWIAGNGQCDEPSQKSVEQERLETMRGHAMQIKFSSVDSTFPKSLVEQPIYRYDDPARGYVDGTVWRLGAKGRPKAIVTTELHPKYNGPCIVCDYLSMTPTPFNARVAPATTWSPSESGVIMAPLPDGPKLAESKAQRLFQLKKESERFQGHQTVEGQQLELRLLPRPIDRYQPSEQDDGDAAIFVFVSGRNPGMLLVLEANGDDWQYGVGRLSGPSTLTLSLDGKPVWRVAPAVYQWSAPYTASNYPIVIPGFLSPDRDEIIPDSK